MERYPTDDEGLSILLEESVNSDGILAGPFLENNDSIREHLKTFSYRATPEGGYELRGADGSLIFRSEGVEQIGDGNSVNPPGEERSQ